MMLTLFSGMAVNVMAAESRPFYPGETLKYKLRWEFVAAGEATLKILPYKMVSGESACHFVMTAQTNAFVDAFYKVRDRIDAYADRGMTRSLLYRKNQKEGRHKRDITVRFDWQNRKAQYTNSGKAKPPVALMPGTFDPLSAFYFTRMADLRENAVIERPVTDGKKTITGKVRVLRRETITVTGGTFDTYLLEPDIEAVGGVFEKSRDARLHVWVTADHRRIPVRVKSKVAVGSFVGELVSVTEGQAPNSKHIEE
ncbi:DUF3108 domain-containing protein [Desulfonema ishimotonii]|nr:DUF3108 domain-containing protein [Desulfonema ishimotonii]